MIPLPVEIGRPRVTLITAKSGARVCVGLRKPLLSAALQCCRVFQRRVVGAEAVAVVDGVCPVVSMAGLARIRPPVALHNPGKQDGFVAIRPQFCGGVRGGGRACRDLLQRLRSHLWRHEYF